MHWPQITMIVLWSGNIAVNIVKHGQLQKPYKYDAFRTMIAVAIVGWVLTEGGFFNAVA